MEIIKNYASVCPIVQVKNALSKEQCETIANEILDFKATGPEMANSNDHCWRSPVLIGNEFEPGIKQKTFQSIQDVLIQAINEYNKFVFSHETYLYKLLPRETIDYSKPKLDAWFNVNKKGGENVVHTHAGTHISGVFYFQAKDTGGINFASLETNYNIVPINYPFFGNARYEPDDGDIIMFPSYLAHWIDPNPIEKERINMAFNIDYVLE